VFSALRWVTLKKVLRVGAMRRYLYLAAKVLGVVPARRCLVPSLLGVSPARCCLVPSLQSVAVPFQGM
jgi:hypothetical protein